MKTRIIYGIVAAAAIMAAGDVSAQKFPERRIARDGNKAYERGDFEASETEYRRALEAEPGFGEARFNLGNALFRQEKAEEAAKIYMSVAADSTANPLMVSEANFNAGNVMLAGQQIEQAIEFYKQALRINPGDMQAKYNLAYAKKLLQNPPPEDQNDDRNDQDKDQNQDQDQNQNDQDRDQDQNNEDQDRDDSGQDDRQGDDKQDQDSPPESDPNSPDEAGIDPQDAEHMLEAIQDEEDKTREKMNAREVPAVGRSGKNW